MSNINVKFLGTEYSIPEDIKKYINMQDFTENVKIYLFNTFLNKIKRDITCIEEPLFLKNELKSQAEKYIRMLCNEEIYTKTVSDYLDNSKGIEIIDSVVNDALRQIKAIWIERNAAYEAGYQEALYKKESSVTGLDFSIWTSSIANLAIYAAMDAAEEHKQEKAALKQYNEDIENLHNNVLSKYKGQEKQYIETVFIPGMDLGITAFSYELLDNYLADLIAADKFNKKTLDYINLKRSNDYLDNLKLSNNKEAILSNAFVACPYNVAVYMNALKFDLLDYDSFQTAKVMKQGGDILTFLKESIGKVSYPYINLDYKMAKLYANFTEQEVESFLSDYTKSYADSIVEEYADIARNLSDKSYGEKLIANIGDEPILNDEHLTMKKAASVIDPIVTKANWDVLVDKCGHRDLLARIKRFIPNVDNINTIEELDSYFRKELANCIEPALNNRREKILARQEEERIKAEEEKKRLEEEKRRKEEEQRKKEELKRQKKEEAKKTIKKTGKVFVIIAIIAAIIAVAVLIWSVVNKNVIIPANQYKEAVALMDAGEYQEAYDLLYYLDDYKDSEALLKQCENEILEERYQEAIYYMDAHQYEAAIIVFQETIDYKDSEEKIAECEELIIEDKYNEAISLAKEGSYKEAIAILEEIGDYKDSVELCEKYGFLGCEAGDVIKFGTYEQDGDNETGKEPIEWRVLKRDGNKALIITEYCIEQKPFNETLTRVSWENCTVRKWLNGAFMDQAFSEKEEEKIISSKISNDGNDTTDKVFLLSSDEAEKYFESDADRSTDATANVSTNYCYWILRTPSTSGPYVCHVDYTGELGYSEVVDREWWLRPAMWLKIK